MSDTLDQTTSQEVAQAPLLKHSFTYAIYAALISMALSLSFYYGGIQQDSWLYRIATWAVTIGIVVWIIRDYRDKKNNGFLSYGRGVGLATLTGVWSGIIVAIYTVLFFTVIAPEALEEIKEVTYNQMLDRGLTEDQAAETMLMTEPFLSPPFFAAMVVIGTPITYCIISLIASAFLKKESA